MHTHTHADVRFQGYALVSSGPGNWQFTVVDKFAHTDQVTDMCVWEEGLCLVGGETATVCVRVHLLAHFFNAGVRKCAFFVCLCVCLVRACVRMHALCLIFNGYRYLG